jgi:hypothetical protein
LSVNGSKTLKPVFREKYGSSIAQRAFVNPAGLFHKSVFRGKGLR